jgi:hypothetical protein
VDQIVESFARLCSEVIGELCIINLLSPDGDPYRMRPSTLIGGQLILRKARATKLVPRTVGWAAKVLKPATLIVRVLPWSRPPPRCRLHGFTKRVRIKACCWCDHRAERHPEAITLIATIRPYAARQKGFVAALATPGLASSAMLMQSLEREGAARQFATGAALQ